MHRILSSSFFTSVNTLGSYLSFSPRGVCGLYHGLCRAATDLHQSSYNIQVIVLLFLFAVMKNLFMTVVSWSQTLTWKGEVLSVSEEIVHVQRLKVFMWESGYRRLSLQLLILQVYVCLPKAPACQNSKVCCTGTQMDDCAVWEQNIFILDYIAVSFSCA